MSRSSVCIFNKSMERALLIVLVACLLTACGSNKSKSENTDKPAKLESYERRVKLVSQWSHDLGKGQGKDYYRLSIGISAEGVCAASVDGRVACYSHEGKKQWKAKLDEKIAAGVGVTNKFALLVDTNGKLRVLDRQTGEPLWSEKLDGQVLAAPQADDNIIVVQTTDGRVIGFDDQTRKKRWEYTADEPRLTLRGTATPVIDRGVLYTGFANGKLVALNTDNASIVFDQAVAIASGTAEIERIVDIDASPVVTSDAVYSASFSGNLFAFDRRSGRPLWRTTASTYRELAYGLEKVYLTDEESNVFAFDSSSGDERWLQKLLINRNLSAPAIFEGYLLIADYKGYLHVLSQVDGTIVGRTRTDRAGVRVPMRTYRDNLYVYTDDGKLIAYQLENLAQ